MFMFTYPTEPCSSRTWYPGQVGDVLMLLQQIRSRYSCDVYMFTGKTWADM